MREEGRHDDKLITRSEAVEVLVKLADTDIFDEEITAGLEQIITNIRNEAMGLDTWGGSYAEIVNLFQLTRADLVTQELVEHKKNLAEKYRIKETYFHQPNNNY